MWKEEAQSGSQMKLAPVIGRSGWRNGLIRVREWLLNRLTGVNPSLEINDQLSHETISPGTELAAGLKTTLMELKTSFMDEGGASVDYAALRSSLAYAAYRREQLAALRHFDPNCLLSPAAARAFWINLYNALVIDAVIHFNVQESVIAGRLGMLTFFRRAAYQVGGQRVSLADMEYGILRGNRGNPYLPGVHFAADDPRLGWALPVDPRLHFALNCGGRSCPPIRAYEPERLNRQLDLAARGFVDATVKVWADRGEVLLSEIFRWFAVDFGGRAGIEQFLAQHLPDDERRRLLLSAGTKLRFSYLPYDWRLNAI